MKTGLFFGSTNGEVEAVAEDLKAALGASVDVCQNIGDSQPKDLEACDNLILGISTWNVGLLQADWDVFWPKMDTINLTDKKVAIFGQGDQVGYPDSYQDALGQLADKVTERGATLVGLTSRDGQDFTATKVMKDGRMKGLCVDTTNQEEKTAERVAAWVPQIKRELGLA